MQYYNINLKCDSNNDICLCPYNRSSWVKIGGTVYKPDNIVAISSDLLPVFGKIIDVLMHVPKHVGAVGAIVRRRAINSRAYASVPYRAARMLNQLRRGHRAWPMFELKSGAAMAAPAAPMPPPLDGRCCCTLAAENVVH